MTLRIQSHWRDPVGARDVSQRLGDECGIAVGFFHAGFQIRRHFFRCAQMPGHVVKLRTVLMIFLSED